MGLVPYVKDLEIVVTMLMCSTEEKKAVYVGDNLYAIITNEDMLSASVDI